MRLLLGHDATVAEWVGERIGSPMVPPYTALGWLDDVGNLAVGVCFFNFVPGGNIEMGLAASGRLTRGILSAVAHYAFFQVGARRITARVKRGNERAADMLMRAGFKAECNCKRYYADDDAMQFRMFKSECKWLKDS